MTKPGARRRLEKIFQSVRGYQGLGVPGRKISCEEGVETEGAERSD